MTQKITPIEQAEIMLSVFDDVNGAHHELASGVHHFNVVLVRARGGHHFHHLGHLVHVGQIDVAFFVGQGVSRLRHFSDG